MDGLEILDELRKFLLVNIATYEQLETLYLLHANSDREWTAELVATALKLPVRGATKALEHLCEQSLLVARLKASVRTFQYAPASQDQAFLVDLLVRTHDTDRLAIMNLMSNNAIDRVRTRTARMFADAFIFGRRKDEDG